MESFFNDINSSITGEGFSDLKKVRHVFEFHSRFLEGAGCNSSTHPETTPLLGFAMQFRGVANFTCAALCLEIQLDCLPDTAIAAFTNECVQLFREIDNSTVQMVKNEG